MKTSWKPKPIDPPQVDPALHHLDPITRSTESIRYSLLSTRISQIRFTNQGYEHTIKPHEQRVL